MRETDGNEFKTIFNFDYFGKCDRRVRQLKLLKKKKIAVKLAYT